MINFIHFSYVPNTASTNRLLSYIRSIPQEIKIRLFFIMPDKNFSKIENTPSNVSIVYCWDKFSCKNKLLIFFSYHLSLSYIRKQLKSGDIVYCYNIPLFMKKLFKTGVKYYGERTEHPLCSSGRVSRLIKFNLKEHLELCNNLDGLFVISKALKKYYIENGVDESKIEIINMTVDSSRFLNLKKEKTANKYIAYCGTASNNKDGVDKLIKSFALVNKKYKDIKLYIIGNAPNKLEKNGNYQLAEKLGMLDNIVFTGLISSDDIPQMLKNATILALARPNNLQAQHGFPTKLGEYLLSENPVVVTKVGDIPLFLKDKETAILAEPDNIEDFADKLCWVLEHPKESEIIGLNGRNVAMKFFNCKNEIKKIIYFITDGKNNI